MKKGDFMSPRSKRGCGDYSTSNPARRRDAIRRHKKEWEKTERAKRYRRNNYVAKINFLMNCKVQLGCKKCGINDHVILVFHHVNPGEKELDVSSACACRSWGVILKEIEKCEILCFNHHTIEHKGLWNWKLRKNPELFEKDKSELRESQLSLPNPSRRFY